MQNKVLVDTEDDILSLRKSTSPESSAQRSYPIFRIYYQTDVNKPKLPATAILSITLSILKETKTTVLALVRFSLHKGTFPCASRVGKNH